MSNIDFAKIESKIDTLLESETKESLTEWLSTHKAKGRYAYSIEKVRQKIIEKQHQIKELQSELKILEKYSSPPRATSRLTN